MTFNGVSADTCSIVSNTEVTATFTTGVPIAQVETVPELVIIDARGDYPIE